ncbi:MAG: SGNH/GDSL hydrolase family protein [Lentisphaerae bacterium]|jgi:hypothetical protein|nr:SGNH/GDSL hydrolase family protein [Lentisphaerota bacterium]MBT4821531.1 SGNH/GDSL hydrolase family protein [Lentisphaerota bacterium]MBT5606957.1 SGNH/GDSL hydrolase family protein [Lentisphaerota bacterium]MBT7055110.1 SGNH/GDSL hydrolase family protein [Lentisphaerota bacterium]MBT7842224.1 SGNH/GDSL hydrolase family protein [Lentisphaerota bacterium]
MQVLRSLGVAALAFSAATVPGGPAQMTTAEEPEELGKTLVGRTYFPKPEGTDDISVPNGSFEEIREGRVHGWTVTGGTFEEEGAPAGGHYVSFPAKGRRALGVSGLDIRDGQPHLLSCWLRSEAPFGGTISVSRAAVHYGRHVPISFPSTGGEWKRVGCYFRNLPGGEGGRLSIRPGRAALPAFSIDEVTLRTATEDEFSRAWGAWRASLPARDLGSRSTDGRNLALTIGKLTGGRALSRPFLIWAIGSSYTNMLGNGEALRQHIRRRFPNAPEIIYKKHVGSAVPWQYVRGWARHIVVPEQPDLVLIYTLGDPSDLNALLQELREGTTADIIVPSIHWRIRDKKNWGVVEDAVDQKVSELREVCLAHGVEFVESRREWAAYMREHRMEVAIDAEAGLLKDAVHQSDHGALVINENIARHFAVPDTFSYEPSDRERRLSLAEPFGGKDGEQVTVSGEHRRGESGELVFEEEGACLRVTFRGNRIDVWTDLHPSGGTGAICIDGVPGGEVTAFYPTYISCGPKNARPERGSMADQCPHGVVLGSALVPQKWTIEMLDDNGNFELTGSVTGRDGRGQNETAFTSTSGQIRIVPELWRRQRVRRSKVFTNREGDTFTFAVVRSCQSVLSTHGDVGSVQCHRVVSGLPNGLHLLEIRAKGDGALVFRGVDVYEPPAGR